MFVAISARRLPSPDIECTKNVEKERLGSMEKEMTLPIQQREWLVLGMENTSVMCDISVFAHIVVYFVCKLLSVPVPNTMFVRRSPAQVEIYIRR